jgi:hypothetical protein
LNTRMGKVVANAMYHLPIQMVIDVMECQYLQQNI